MTLYGTGPVFCSLFNMHDERAMPDRRVGKQPQFCAVYGSASPTEVLLVMLPNARPSVVLGQIGEDLE
ncbi:MAG: hypothetical protein V4712_00300, partial [Pseudomonadota bacterium]